MDAGMSVEPMICLAAADDFQAMAAVEADEVPDYLCRLDKAAA